MTTQEDAVAIGLYLGVKLTCYMEQSPPWEAVSSSAGQELRRILWNPKICEPVYKSLPLLAFLSQINPVHTLERE
jgi:hypothetical protein